MAVSKREGDAILIAIWMELFGDDSIILTDSETGPTVAEIEAAREGNL